MRQLLLSFLVAVAVGAAAPSSSPDAGSSAASSDTGAAPLLLGATKRETCQQDSDCVVTNYAGCCACPQCSSAPPRARTRAGLKFEMDLCGVTSCDMAMCGIAGMCPAGEDAAHFRGRCSQAQCTLERIERPRR